MSNIYKKMKVCCNILQYKIKTDKVYEHSKLGDSIAINGVCLTVVKKYNNIIVFQIMPHTRRSTNLGNLKINEKVNLESSLKLGDRISGHFVYGHIDCIGIIRKRTIIQDNLCFQIAIPLISFLQFFRSALLP